MIHICYALRDESGKYSKFVGTSIYSLFENTKSEVTIHLIHDTTLSDENRLRFIEIVDKFNQQIIFYNVDILVPDSIRYAEKKLPETKNFRGTIATMYRLLIPKLLPKNFDRVIYLDADTIINLDISELWNIDLENFPIAATPHFFSFPDLNVIRNGIQIDSVEIDPHDYFNAGVLLFDLSKIRKFPRNLFSSSIKILLQNPRNNSLDQDSLNIIFKDNFLKLPSKFNNLVSWFYNDSSSKILHEIYHYIGDSLGIDLHFEHNRLWFEYFVRTPFCNPNSFENMAKAYDEIIQKFQQIADNQLILFQKILRESSNRRRVFFVCPNDESLIFEVFGHREDDLIIDATRENALIHIIQIAQRFHTAIVLFFCITSTVYSDICKRLSLLGLSENEDFFNSIDLISCKQLRYLSNPIIRDM